MKQFIFIELPTPCRKVHNIMAYFQSKPSESGVELVSEGCLHFYDHRTGCNWEDFDLIYIHAFKLNFLVVLI